MGKAWRVQLFWCGMGKDETSGRACVVKGLEYHRKKETETVLSGAMEGFQQEADLNRSICVACKAWQKYLGHLYGLPGSGIAKHPATNVPLLQHF